VKSFRGSFSGYERNAFFLRGRERFVDAAHGLGAAFDHDGRAVAPIDVDGDGDLDLAVLSLQGLQLLENTSKPRNWVRFRLQAKRSEGHALGATVKIHAGGRTQIDRVRLTAGFQPQVSPDVHFGLGDAMRIEGVEIAWPSGETLRLRGLQANQRYLLVEGEPERPFPLPAWPEDTRPRGQSAYSLDVPLRTMDGAPGKLEPRPQPTILNFWAPWCEACTREVPALARIARRGVRVVGVSVETAKLEEVRAFVAKHGLSYPQRLATDAAIEAFFGPGGRMTLPATFVFDAEGRLRRSHFREIDEQDLTATIDTLRAPASARDHAELASAYAKREGPKRGLELLARAIELDPKSADLRWQLGMASLQTGHHPQGLAALEAAVRLAPDDDGFRADLAGAYRAAGQLPKAESTLRAAAQRWPTSSRVWRDLGALHAHQGRYDLARKAFRESLRLRDDQARLWKELAELEGTMGRLGDAQSSRLQYERLTGKKNFAGGE